MAAHEKASDRATRRAHDARVACGRELRIARLACDLSQRAGGRAIGVSGPTWSRLEQGEVDSLLVLARAMAVVGLELHVRAYPGGRPVRDAAHVRLLERFHGRLGPGVGWRTEVPLPNAGDQRVWDGLVLLADLRVGVEAETRGRDVQELQRRLTLKRRDGNVDDVILLLADTRHNRSFLRACPESFRADFPLDGPLALQRLGIPTDPGGSAIILL